MSKKKNDSNSSIKCNVSSCDYNNCEKGTCCLEKVEISCSCDGKDCADSCETICQSFTTTGGDITDNEYEVQSEDE